MTIHQSRSRLVAIQNDVLFHVQGSAGAFWIRTLLLTAVYTAALFALGGSSVPAAKIRAGWFGMPVAGMGFDLLSWEISALREKGHTALSQPARELEESQAQKLVWDYLSRSAEMNRLEREMNAVHGTGEHKTDQLQREMEELRQEQKRVRPAVEQVIQSQVSSSLAAEGFGIAKRPVPPVQFTFTEPPRKLVVSPRDRIETIYGRMLQPEISLDEIEEAEQSIRENADASAYITNIGGLGAFPTMVIDRASLPWILNTVAHEWAHNYLAFFPLGWFYFASQDMTTINESVAEIVGDEIGAEVFLAYYGKPAEPREYEEEQELVPEEAPFDFRQEMRATRLEVDRLLAEGNVNEAEAYMEERRELFVDNGYPLRVLNQAYFAFHGSYGTSPASTSPIGPKLRRLRELSPDLRTFLHTARTFTSPEDLDEALLKLGAAQHPEPAQGSDHDDLNPANLKG